LDFTIYSITLRKILCRLEDEPSHAVRCHITWVGVVDWSVSKVKE
jgi:hypothetical protein